MSKIRVEYGGMNFPAPFSPYAKYDGIKKRYLAPSLINCMPSCHPFMTLLSGHIAVSPLLYDESNIVPSIRKPS